MIKDIQPRALAHLLDGQEHAVSELLGLVRGLASPEDLVRAYLRKHSYRQEHLDGQPYEEQVRRGLEIALLEALKGLELKGVVVMEYRRGDTWVGLTPSGFDSCVERGKNRMGTQGRSGRVLAQLAQLITSGEYHIRLEPRERTPACVQTEPVAGADP